MTDGPKVLLFDLETAPMQVYTFSLWEPRIGMDQIITPPRIMCWSARWAGTRGKTVMFDSEKNNPAGFLTGLRDLMDEADVVVGYNSDSFDIPWTNEQFITAGIELPSPYIKVDLYKIAKRYLKMPSRKLDYLALDLLGERKVKHEGFSLWKKCMDPDHPDYEKAWRDMERYAKKDTLLLDPLFAALKPYITSVNFGLHAKHDFACTHCGSQNLQARGYAYTTAGKFQRYQCTDCGAWSKDPKRIEGTALRPMANV